MRDLIRRTVPQLSPPSQAARDAAASGQRTAAEHRRIMAAWDCLTHLEVHQPAQTPVTDSVTVAAWNIERCKRAPEAADLVRRCKVDIVLATEMDLGMARSGQRHTTRDMATEAGLGYAFGVEFVELGIGDPYETGLFAGLPNDHGLHGNAILSRFPMERVALLPLDDGGRWFTSSPKNDGQFRIGGRMAIAARIGDVTFVSVHYESESDAAGRAELTKRMLDMIDAEYGAGPCVIGGDLNTARFAAQRMTGAETLGDPASVEPSFAAFAGAGFDWQSCNAPGVTTRAAPGNPAPYPLKKLDWLFVRGVTGANPAIAPAISDRGDYLSDHEMITTRITP